MAPGGNQQEIKFLIELLAKNQGAIEAAKALTNVGKASDTANKKLGFLGEAVQGAGLNMVKFMGAAALGAFAVSAVKAFAAVEHGFNGLALQLKQLGTEASQGRIKEFLEEIQSSGDGLVSETLPAFRQFLGLIGSVNGAMTMTELAVRIADEGVADFGQATSILSGILAGKVGPGLKALEINARGANGELLTAEEAMRAVATRFTAASANIQDTTDTLDRLAGMWETFKVSAGGAIVYVVDVLKEMVGGLAGLGALLYTVLNPSSYLDGWDGFLDSISKNIESTWEYMGLKADSSGEEGHATGAEFAKGLEEALKVAGAKKEGQDAEAAAEALKKAAELAKQIAAANEAAEQQLLQAKIGMMVEGSDERLRVEMALLDRQHEEALAAAEEIGADTAAIEQTFAIARAALLLENSEKQKELALADAEIQRELQQRAFDAEKQIAEERLELFNRDREAEIGLAELHSTLTTQGFTEEAEALKAIALLRMKEALRQTKTMKEQLLLVRQFNQSSLAIEQSASVKRIQIAQQYAQAAQTIGNAVFGDNKAMAIASAIINTYLAATLAFANTQGGIYAQVAAMVVAIAAGLAQVAVIRGTKKQNSTFDDPTNDRLAFLGGRRSVEDFIRLTNSGLKDGLEDVEGSPAGSPVEEFHFHQHAPIYGGPEGLQEVGRAIDRARRLDRGRLAR